MCFVVIMHVCRQTAIGLRDALLTMRLKQPAAYRLLR